MGHWCISFDYGLFSITKRRGHSHEKISKNGNGRVGKDLGKKLRSNGCFVGSF